MHGERIIIYSSAPCRTQGLARVDRLDQRALDADGERVLTLSGG
jgi:hypothetical protein